LGRGNLGVTVEIETGGEIGELAAVFNEMSHSLKEAEGQKIQQAAAARELEMARNIQTSVLPKDGVTGPYAFMGYMETATEVGGDYYDLIEITKGGKRYWWFLIGDVCGHGLQAGITMLMAQTAFQAAMEIKPDLKPDEAFVYVNKVLFANVKHLKENRYMTATFFRADASGRIEMAGLHQDVLIFRKKKRRVEIIESAGLWLALEPDIRKETRNTKFHLDPGDLLFLFTDGITEAMDSASNLFGQDRLIEVLEEHGQGDLDQLRTSVVNAIKAHQKGRRPHDDITFAMIRRNK
ncbi:MAG: SpoIIE family protein phosphatase, partial [Spirochaetia bacterium]|nr:SpoIIE family protein phosphatase [Spirochaetia bacterium]